MHHGKSGRLAMKAVIVSMLPRAQCIGRVASDRAGP
jgi:hypothetical protein